MQNSAIIETPLRDLFRGLTGETKKFIKEEAQLARAELTEKISHLGRNGVILAVGGCLAYAGLIVFLAGLGVLLAFAFEKAGLSAVLSGFLGLVIIGLLFATIGGLMAFKAVKKLSRESLAPEKTVRTLQEFKGSEPAQTRKAPSTAPQRERSPGEIEASVRQTERKMGETLDEIKWRLSPRHMREEVRRNYEGHPYRWNLAAWAAGLVGGIMIMRKFRHNEA